MLLVYGLAYNSFVATSSALPDDFGNFDNFNVRWYLAVGTPLVMTVTLQLFFPHIDLILLWLYKASFRCWDRSCTCRAVRTKQFTQSEYEDLYTGPEFNMEVRMAQVLSTVVLTMTFSSGMPCFYLVPFIGFLLISIIDKYLVLRYYRKRNTFSHHLT